MSTLTKQLDPSTSQILFSRSLPIWANGVPCKQISMEDYETLNIDPTGPPLIMEVKDGIVLRTEQVGVK